MLQCNSSFDLWTDCLRLLVFYDVRFEESNVFNSSSIIHGHSSLEHLNYCIRIISFLDVMFEERNRREIIFILDCTLVSLSSCLKKEIGVKSSSFRLYIRSLEHCTDEFVSHQSNKIIILSSFSIIYYSSLVEDMELISFNIWFVFDVDNTSLGFYRHFSDINCEKKFWRKVTLYPR